MTMDSSKVITANFTEVLDVPGLPLLVDWEFDDSADSDALRTDGAGQDWYESRGWYSGGDSNLLVLDESDVGGNTGKKAGFIESTSGNAYMTQEFSSPQTGVFTVQWDLYVDWRRLWIECW